MLRPVLALIRSRVRPLALAALAASALTVHAADGASAADVRVANFTGFSDAELRAHLAKTLPDATIEAFAGRNLAVFAFTAQADGRRACYAMVGVTEAAPPGLNARIPTLRFGAFTRARPDDWDPAGCMANRLRRAIASLAETPIDDLLGATEPTRASSDADRVAEAHDATRVHVISIGVADTQAILDRLLARNVARAFDYRHTATSVYADGVRFDDGSLVCVAIAGLAARSPADRNGRWPGSHEGIVRTQDSGTVEACNDTAALAAVDAFYDRPWTPAGLLRDVARTRERGVPLPDPKRVAAARPARPAADASPPPRPVRVAARTEQRNVVSCTNRCVNGSCVRTFADGRTERWQAPRVYDPMTRNWTWDVTTNACGT
jgi:hypothetical protein